MTVEERGPGSLVSKDWIPVCRGGVQVGRWKMVLSRKIKPADALNMLRRLKFRNSTLHRDRHWQRLNCDGGLSFWAAQGEQTLGGTDRREGGPFLGVKKQKTHGY